MKITCQACAAKYTIADDKVLGKVVKIRCKKCGATIVVNGNDPSAGAGAAAAESQRAYDYAPQSGGDAWTVNVADGDQRTLTDAEIAAAYQAGEISDDTFCWKDGMTDWLPIKEIEQLYSACTATRVAAPGMGAGDATKIQDAGPALFGQAASPAPAYAAPRPSAGRDANGGSYAPPAAAAAPAPAAARRAGGRAPGADLFGTAAQAGGEEDVMTSAPAGMPQVHGGDEKLTGARNENSVLFSLNALTSKPGGGPATSMPAGSEQSGLIDIRNLSAQIGMGEDKKRSRVDDIMNLAGGGAFSPSLTAPVLSAPPIEEYAPAPEAAGATGAMAPVQSKSKGIIFAAIGAGVVVVGGAIVAAVMIMGKGDSASKDKAAASASAAAVSTVTPSASLALNTPPPSSADTASATAAPTTTTSAPAPTDTSTAAATSTATTAPTTKPTTAPTTKPTATSTATAAPTPAPTPAPPSGGSDQPFNMGEAKAKLGAIASSVQSCKKGDGGAGRAVITFNPSGSVASVSVSGVDSATAACVSARFRSAHVPPFAGGPFSVSKSFTIN